MKKILLLLLIPISVFADVTVKDDSGRSIHLEKPASRIISLAPSITELLFSAGAGTKVVGVVAHSDFPEQAKQIPRVGGYTGLDLEKIISLKPDLVIAWQSGYKQSQLARISELGIPVYMSEPGNILSIADSIKAFGILAGTETVAKKNSTGFIQRYQAIKNQYFTSDKISVFYQLWDKPLMTVSGNHIISQVIELCGGKNIFADLNSQTPVISLEAVLGSGADVVISGGMNKSYQEWIAEWQKWSGLNAVKYRNFYLINPDLMQRAGPRLLDGAQKLCEAIKQSRERMIK